MATTRSQAAKDVATEGATLIKAIAKPVDHSQKIGCVCNAITVKFIVTIISCFLMTCTLGMSYTFGNLDPYLTSYLRNKTDDNGMDYTKSLWIYQSNNLVSSLALPVVGIFANRIQVKVFLLLGIVLFAGTLFGTYFTVKMSYWWVMTSYGFLSGIPGAFMYPTLIRIPVQWLPSKTGLLTGVILMGYGVGAFMWNTLITWFINRKNLQPDLRIGNDLYYTQEEVLDKVPDCFIVLGTVTVVLNIICLILIREPPEPKSLSLIINEDGTSEQQRDDQETCRSLLADSKNKDIRANSESRTYGACADTSNSDIISHDVMERREEEEGCEENEENKQRQYTLGEVAKTRVFWTFWLFYFFLQIGVAFPISLWKAYGQSFINDDHFLGIIASVSSVSNAIGRPPFGMLADRFGSRIVCLILLCVLAVSMATINMCQYMGAAGWYVFLFWVCGMFSSMCGIFTMIPTMLIRCFGTKHYNAIEGLTDFGGLFAAILPTIAAPAIKDWFGWYGLFVFSFVNIFIAILLNLCLTLGSVPRHLKYALDR